MSTTLNKKICIIHSCLSNLLWGPLFLFMELSIKITILFKLMYISDNGKDDSEDSESSSGDEETTSDSPKKTTPKKESDEVSEKLSNLTVSEQERTDNANASKE